MQKLKYLLLLSLLLNFACVKDNSSTSDIELNSVYIGGIEKVYNIKLGETLEIDPKIATLHDNSSNLDYVWYKYDLGMTVADTISHEKKLSVVVDDVAPGVECIVVFKVTDRTTGIFTLHKTSLFTTAIYSGGIVALTKDGDKIDMAFVSTGSGEVTANMFSGLNPDITLPSSTNSIYYRDPVDASPADYRRVVITTNDDKIGVVLDPDLLTKKEYVSEMFTMPLATGKNYNISGYGNDNGNEILIIDGKLYDRISSPWDSGTKFNPAMVSTKSPNYQISPILMHVDGLYGAPMVFDNEIGTFMCFADGGRFTYVAEGPNVSFSHFNPNKLPGLELVAAGTTAVIDDGIIGDWYTLMRNKATGNLSMLEFKYGSVYDEKEEDYVVTYETLMNQDITRDNCPMLYKATQIVGGDRIYPRTSYPWIYPRTGFAGMMFYLANNNVYVYNVANGAEVKLVDGTESGFTIDKIIVSKTSYINEDQEIAYNPRLGLCIRDNAATTKKGGVAYYRVTTLGGIQANQYFKKTGFCDQVLDFDEKLN